MPAEANSQFFARDRSSTNSLFSIVLQLYHAFLKEELYFQIPGAFYVAQT